MPFATVLRATRAPRPTTGLVAFVVGACIVAGPTLSRAQDAPVDFTQLAEPIMPAVVNISTERALPPREARPGPHGEPRAERDEGGVIEDFLRRFFGRTGFVPAQMPGPSGEGGLGEGMPGMPQMPGAPQDGTPDGRAIPFALGSGFVVSQDGLIVTNNHVVEGAASITVTLHDGREFQADLVGRDEMTEIAVLRIPAPEPLPVLGWGDSDAVQVGEWVLAFGNPFGIGNTLTAGVVSARPRAAGLEIPIDVLQTDAALNLGNSGGPLVNRRGQVVGVNVAILSPTGGDIGIGFAVPANVAVDVVETLVRDGEVRRGWLGVAVQPIDERLAGIFGATEGEGALVGEVVPDSPAEAAGLRPGDIVLAVRGEPIEEPRELMRVVAETQPGTHVQMTVLRQGQSYEIEAPIADRRRSPEVQGGERADRQQAAPADPGLGLALAPVTGEVRRLLDLEEAVEGAAVLDIDPRGAAAVAGLRPGDIITHVGGNPVTDPAGVERNLDALQRQGIDNALLYVRRGDRHRFVGLPLEGT